MEDNKEWYIEDKKPIAEYSTPNGKVIQVVPCGSMYRIQFATGGELPKDFQGMFTGLIPAESVIKTYLNRKQEKEVTTNGPSKGVKAI